MNIKNILCVSHGTIGARTAEKVAVDLCGEGVSLHLLVVTPDFWKDMMGDDWLNNAVTQKRFGNYVEEQLESEVAEVVWRMEQQASSKKAEFSHTSVLGKPTQCLIDADSRERFDLIIIGSPRPKGMEGYHSRMDLEVLTHKLKAPLLIIPHPAQ